MRQPIPFGKYVLLERISVGGMAEVFKAKSFGVEGFEKILAIKRILPSLAEDSDFIEMFIDEAKICGQLNHANICQIFELGRVADSHFIAMEYVWGKDLLQMQNRFRKLRQTMKPEMAAFVAAKMCEGLDYAHKKKDATGRPLGIIHRDISPQNILVSYEGELKIIDFGIAKAASRSSKTQAGVLKGKFGYMSPEQVRGLPLDRRSDVFAIGTILYELLTADRLFVGESDFETLEKVRNVDVKRITTVNKAVPEALAKVIHKALSKDIEDRYQWGNEMQEELQSFLMGFDPVFTAKQLSHWMREAFAAEMRREQEILDQQRKVGREVLTAPIAQSFGAHASLVSAAPRSDYAVPEGTNVVSDDDLAAMAVSDSQDSEGGDFDEKTTVSATPFDPSAPPPAHAPVAATAAPLPEQKTQILGESGAPAPAPLPSQSTMILDGSSPRPLPKAAPDARTMMEMPAPVLPAAPSVVVSPQVTPLGTGQVIPMPPQRRPSTLWKDIVIGVAVAALLVGGVLGVRAFSGRGKGTLVVMANPARAADVLVDGALKGHIEEGKPLTLKDLTAGVHAVRVRAADGSEFSQKVSLAAGDVSVMSAPLAVVAAKEGSAPGTGTLKLELATDGAQVWVDGAQLADGAWKQPIPLRADVPHEIRVSKPNREEVKLTVTLKPGEELQKAVELLPAYAKLKISSVPDGAEVNVNGHRAGVTPTQVSDLDPGKSARVTIRLKGYRSATKYVGFDKGLEQELAVTLVEGKDDGAGEPEVVAVADKPKAPKPVLADVAVDEKKPAKKEKEEDLAPVRVAAREPAKEKDPPKESAAKAGGGEPGFLVANTQPWAKVLIDGKDTGKTTPIAPRSKISLKPGKHVVTFVANGKRFNFDIVIKPAEDTRLIKQLADTP